MSDSLPPNIHFRLQERLEPTRPPTEIPWIKLLLVLVAVGVLGWYGYQYWEYRLPQERVLTDLHGQALHVKIEGRNDLVLSCDLLDQSPAPLVSIPICDLTAEDQALVHHFAANYVVQPPVALPPAGLVGQGGGGFH